MPFIDDLLLVLQSVPELRQRLQQALFGNQPSFVSQLSQENQRQAGQSPQQLLQEAFDPNSLASQLAMNFMPGGMAKTFAPGPGTLEALIQLFAKTGQKLAPRNRLLPAIRHPQTGEIFAGEVGGRHPHDVVANILTGRRQTVPGNLEFGFQIPGEKPFIPELIANQLQTQGPGGIAKSLEGGSTIQDLIELLKGGRLE